MRVLWALVILEAIIIAALITSRYRIIIRPTLTPIRVVESPLELALRYDASDAKFEELVTEDPEWTAYRGTTSDWPILANCAFAKKTNYVRILIAHGANVKEAVKSLEKVDADEAVNLLRQVESELKSQR